MVFFKLDNRQHDFKHSPSAKHQQSQWKKNVIYSTELIFIMIPYGNEKK